MNIIGLTIAKNCNKFSYPIGEMIEQSSSFFTKHFIGVPTPEQDTDGTRDLIILSAKKCDANVELINLDWPDGNAAWTEESLDKTLQQRMLDIIEPQYDSTDTWICKQDADEFYNDDAIEDLREMMDVLKDSNTSTIAHNYRQYMGSLRYYVDDPTKMVSHIFKPGKAKFVGNDAMQFGPTEGELAYLDHIFLHHIGYVKNSELISTRIREHLVLNASMYPDAVHNDSKWIDYKFEFPKHVVGATLWPIGISDKPNEIEYFQVDLDTLPSVLKDKIQEFDFYVPDPDECDPK